METFDVYCLSIRIEDEHHVPHVHIQDGRAEMFIKRLQLIAQTLAMRTKIPDI